MSKPAVDAHNYQAVYEFYGDYKPNKTLAKVGHWAMAAAMRPRVQYLGDAELHIQDLLAQGTSLVLAGNHVTDKDQYVVAGLAHSVKSLRPVRGNTFIPAKKVLFDNPLLRRGVEIMGAIPVFRRKDMADDPDYAHSIRKQGQLALAMIDTSISLLDQGRHMAIFPEGERNPDQPREVQPLQSGIGRIVCGVSSDTELAIVPIGLYYGEAGNLHTFKPDVCIGEPMRGPFEPKQLQVELQQALQTSVDVATIYSSYYSG